MPERGEHVLADVCVEVFLAESVLVLESTNASLVEVLEDLVGYFAIDWLLKNSIHMVLPPRWLGLRLLVHFGGQRLVGRVDI